MPEIINAKGLACPQPVILTKKALDSNDEVIITVDNVTALENIKRLAASNECNIETVEEPESIFRITIKRRQDEKAVYNIHPEPSICDDKPSSANGPIVFVISSTVMGKGDDELGALLMKAFVHTIVDLDRLPHVIILYNAGVKLATLDYGVSDDLKELEAKGVKILVCGTCVNFFELSEKIGVGILSNMYDIANVLTTAGRIVKP